MLVSTDSMTHTVLVKHKIKVTNQAIPNTNTPPSSFSRAISRLISPHMVLEKTIAVSKIPHTGANVHLVNVVYKAISHQF